MLEQKFPACNVCGMFLAGETDLKGNIMGHCKLCGMAMKKINRFCCEKCERTFQWLSKKKKVVEK